MKIAVMGAGGVGGYFGAKLAASGEDVHFIARGAHLEAMQKNGLQVLSANGDVQLKPGNATGNPASVGPVDLVMIAVKLWSTEDALRDAKPMVGPNTAVVSFQNGVVAVDAIAKQYGKERTLGGVANIAAVIEKPGVIRHTGTMAMLSIGELDGKPSARTKTFLDACSKAGIQARVSDDIQKTIWEKYVFLVAASAMTSLTRLPLGAIREDPDTRALTKQIMSEVVAVGKAKAVNLDSDLADKLLERLDGMPREMVASMLGDLERGNRLELPWLSGGVVEMGKQLGIATPANGFIVAALKLYINGRPADARTPKA
ncbi:MAG TPA: 2-dehydropantoate 2-reductase [Burkholderiales bacterium]|nr:2-dehydropantoate 2-reductase [Burkholderiales bacterium]